ncbi:hypothetical protein BYT27DRAFT_7069042, partial [Phlegmacium glaucopus]
DTLFRVGNYSAAKEAYLKIVTLIIGDNVQIPEPGVLSNSYASISDSKRADLMACCNGIAQCELESGNREEAMVWLEEVHIIYLNSRFTQNKTIYDWTKWFPDNAELAIQYATAYATASKSFLVMGNTGAAVHRRWSAQVDIPDSQQSQAPQIMNTILGGADTQNIVKLRHPDPVLVQKAAITEPSLQVLGSWKKIKVKRAGGPGRRLGFSSFIWEGHLYIAGGRRESLGPFYHDMFCLDLNTLDGWKTLPGYPLHPSVFLGWHMIPCPEHKKAYLFTGHPTIDFFDLNTKTWGSLLTKFIRNDPADRDAGVDAWPYRKGQLADSTQQIFDEKLYVFAGNHGNTFIGCNLFLVLDLRTKEWRRLSGTVMAPKDADLTIPGPRKTPNSWVDTVAKKIYIINGECDRVGAQFTSELLVHYGAPGHPYDDFWSWDIESKKWTRERMVGNTPCPRSEAACNPVLDQTITWGGYNPQLPTDYLEQRSKLSPTYYADTFIYGGTPITSTGPSSSSSRKWRQVLTKGFPTYRSQSHLIVDPQSGKTYLFGGMITNEFVPFRKVAISRGFGDLWELRIDLPGGHFEGVNIKDEERTAQLGPWQRC